MDDLIPICRLEGGVSIGESGCGIRDGRVGIWDARYQMLYEG